MVHPHTRYVMTKALFGDSYYLSDSQLREMLNWTKTSLVVKLKRIYVCPSDYDDNNVPNTLILKLPINEPVIDLRKHIDYLNFTKNTYSLIISFHPDHCANRHIILSLHLNVNLFVCVQNLKHKLTIENPSHHCHNQLVLICEHRNILIDELTVSLIGNFTNVNGYNLDKKQKIIVGFTPSTVERISVGNNQNIHSLSLDIFHKLNKDSYYRYNEARSDSFTLAQLFLATTYNDNGQCLINLSDLNSYIDNFDIWNIVNESGNRPWEKKYALKFLDLYRPSKKLPKSDFQIRTNRIFINFDDKNLFVIVPIVADYSYRILVL